MILLFLLYCATRFTLALTQSEQEIFVFKKKLENSSVDSWISR